MKSAIFLIFSIFVIIWLSFTGVILGIIPTEFLADTLKPLAVPTTTAELGSSYAIINGLFLSCAVALGLVAVFAQGQALQKFLKKQNEETAALTFQIAQQNDASKLSALTAQLNYYQVESERIDLRINDLLMNQEIAKREKNDLKEREYWPLIKKARENRAKNDVITQELNVKILQIVEFKPSKED